MDVSEITLFCGVVLAVCLLVIVYVCVSRWISTRTKIPLVLTLLSVCIPNMWLGLVIVALIHS